MGGKGQGAGVRACLTKGKASHVAGPPPPHPSPPSQVGDDLIPRMSLPGLKATMAEVLFAMARTKVSGGAWGGGSASGV